MESKIKFLFALILISITILTLPEKSYAVSSISCPEPGLVNKIVRCLEATIKTTVDGPVITTVRESMQDIVTILLTLYVALFGVRVAFGALRSVRGDFMVVLFTVIFVGGFSRGPTLDDYIKVFISTQAEFVEVVSSSLSTSAVDVPCNEPGIWARIDCTVVYALGIHTAIGDTSDFTDKSEAPFTNDGGFSIALFVIAVGLLFTFLGPIVLFFGLGMAILLFFAFIQVVFIYIGSYLALVFLGIIGPLMVPLVMFPQTKEIFSRWVQMLIAYIIQPALVVGYLVLMIHCIGYYLDKSGLTEIYEDAWEADEARLQYVPTISSCNKTEDSGDCDASTFDDTAAASKDEFATPSYKFTVTGDPEEENKATMSFLVKIIVLIVLQLLTISFLGNVMKFGAQISGVGATAGFAFGNTYQKAYKRLGDVAFKK